MPNLKQKQLSSRIIPIKLLDGNKLILKKKPLQLKTQKVAVSPARDFVDEIPEPKDKTVKTRCKTGKITTFDKAKISYSDNSVDVTKTSSDKDQAGISVPKKRQSKNDNSSQQLSFEFTCQYTAVKPRGFA